MPSKEGFYEDHGLQASAFFGAGIADLVTIGTVSSIILLMAFYYIAASGL
jgi:hypothetical protein